MKNIRKDFLLFISAFLINSFVLTMNNNKNIVEETLLNIKSYYEVNGRGCGQWKDLKPKEMSNQLNTKHLNDLNILISNKDIFAAFCHNDCYKNVSVDQVTQDIATTLYILLEDVCNEKMCDQNSEKILDLEKLKIINELCNWLKNRNQLLFDENMKLNKDKSELIKKNEKLEKWEIVSCLSGITIASMLSYIILLTVIKR